MLKVEKLTVEISWKKILQNINFMVNKWEIFALLGHNGSWKTSVLKSIMGLYPSKGKIFFNGEEIQKFPIYERAKKWIWYIMQEVPEYTGISVIQYVKWILKDKYNEETVKEQFDMFGIDFEVYKDRNFDSHLSWWEKKKVEIIVSFMLEKDLYLLDEIETSLDATSRIILKNMILEKQTNWTSFIIVSHYNELISLAGNSILLCNGRVQEIWKAKELFEKYTWKCENCEIQNNCK